MSCEILRDKRIMKAGTDSWLGLIINVIIFIQRVKCERECGTLEVWSKDALQTQKNERKWQRTKRLTHTHVRASCCVLDWLLRKFTLEGDSQEPGSFNNIRDRSRVSVRIWMSGESYWMHPVTKWVAQQQEHLLLESDWWKERKQKKKQKRERNKRSGSRRMKMKDIADDEFFCCVASWQINGGMNLFPPHTQDEFTYAWSGRIKRFCPITKDLILE